jgi:AcrR family transcriptional regulator
LTEVEERKRERIARRQIDKFADRRDQLAAAALETLAELGYANTSLRDIAQRSGFSHGVLHYYFADKFELINYCVRRYKAECVTRYDAIVATARAADELRAGFGAAMAGTMRVQSLFEENFRGDVAEIDHSLQRMIWRIVTRYAELSERDLAVTPDLAYALLDGVFQHALLRHLSGDPAAAQDLDEHVQQVLPTFLA